MELLDYICTHLAVENYGGAGGRGRERGLVLSSSLQVDKKKLIIYNQMLSVEVNSEFSVIS